MKATKYNKVYPTRRLVAVGLILFAFLGSAWAQSTDPQYVIKKDGHYLAHVYNGSSWVVQNVDEFSPNCLWYSGPQFNPSGTNHNYYFYDGENYRFLAADFEHDAIPYLSASLPAVSILRNSDREYYFYDWDWDEYGGGVARGHKYANALSESECTECGGNWHEFQNGSHECWEVYWLEYNDGWKLTHTSHYSRKPGEDDGHGGVPNAGLFRGVSVTEHEQVITEVSGGALPDLSNYVLEYPESCNPSVSTPVADYVYSYYPAYTTYVFEGGTHNYYGGTDHLTETPSLTSYSGAYQSLEWSLSGDGVGYISFDPDNSNVNTSTSTSPTIYYNWPNNTSHYTATLTLTVTYKNGDDLIATQVRTSTITVKALCGNPGQASDPEVTYEGVTVTWYNTASEYRVYLSTDADVWDENDYVEVNNANSYTFTGLAYHTTYYYRVVANCSDSWDFGSSTVYSFMTTDEPGLLVYGSIFGGGRMADVTGKTEVVVINCDNIGAVYGGNDIAGTVSGSDGAIITLGVDSGDPYASYGVTNAAIKIRDVYGGGNGYYAYNGSSFVAAPSAPETITIANGASVTMQSATGWNETVWTNTTGSGYNLTLPKIKKATVNVSNNYVKIDSLFGGAKNAYLYENAGSFINVDGGTVYAVFGGNNVGGGQGYGWHNVTISGTTTDLTPNITSTNTTGFGRDFGIRYVYGGGNKVYGSTTNVVINGGQCDTVFAGGNAADVYRANATVNCSVASGSGMTYGNTYSQAINSYDGTLSLKDYPSYAWDGTGVYNVRTLFGGNNKAPFDTRGDNVAPIVTLTSGSVGTVYGGGNKGDMLSQEETTLTIPTSYSDPAEQKSIKYSTHVVMNSDNMIVDNLYGGCQMSSVDYSTWVELKKGHVGNVYGGCNVSGDVGSTRVYPGYPWSAELTQDEKEKYQMVYGATYVQVTGGTVYRNVYAGSNGFYHCNDGEKYITSSVNYGDPNNYYIGMTIPTHNETYSIISGGTVKGNVYAGGNMSPVGFNVAYVAAHPEVPSLVGLSAIRMNGGTVNGNVFGGGNMATINGSNEVQISGGVIGGSLYGGNDRTGAVAEISNRQLPDRYNTASDGITPLKDVVDTYISLTGEPNVNTVFGGGNGAYDYSGGGDMQYCNDYDAPIQSNTFVDINIEDNGHIGTVYGGGDGVTVREGLTVFLNVHNPTYADNHDHVGTIFGGNNIGSLDDLVPNIILLNGQVNTVYGGCNEGSLGHHQNFTLGGVNYENIGSLVYLRSSYDGDGNDGHDPVTPTVRVSGHVYGGCRKNGVDYNTLVLVEAGNHEHVGIFGGSDISGNVKGNSRVVVTGGTVGDIYAGGNGGYDYTGALAGLNPPYCASSRVDLINGTVTGNLFAGGYAGLSGSTQVEMSGGSVAGNVFGGGNEAGTTTAEIVTGVTGTGHSTVNITNGTVGTGIYGGCNTSGSIVGNSTVTITGSADNHTAIGDADNDAVIFGGGLGAETSVVGNVTVNFGDLDVDDTKSDYPLLYGELYGGSALGTVNTYDNSNTTTVNVLNGAITGAVFGGGKGLAGNADRGKVNGKVYLNIGSATNASDQSTFKGQATLANCRLFGCNNTNGTPQDEVFVHVYKTAHTAYDVASGDLFAIDSVFGGGNKANYAPLYEGTITPEAGPKSHVYVHGCDNTIQYLFGGGNAADAVGTVTIIEGGHFDEVFGGGNGYFIPANIGTGGAGLNTHGGRYNYVFGGSNMQGTIQGPMYEPTLPSGAIDDCGQAIIDSYFVGTNEAEIYTDLNRTITCAEAGDFKYSYVYGGCRWGIVYGDINLTVQGGTILNVFGGSKGKDIKAADIRRFPSFAELQEDDQLPEGQRKYSQALRDHMGYPGGTEPSYVGHGGNVNITINSGTVGNVYGGCDVNGNVEGQITVIVNKIDCDCGLFVGDVYGGGNKTDYEPDSDIVDSPLVKIEKGTLGGTAVFATGSRTFEGNVFGGGNEADVISNPKVVIGKKSGEVILPVTINGNVYGGGNNGDVKGSPQVIVVPE